MMWDETSFSPIIYVFCTLYSYIEAKPSLSLELKIVALIHTYICVSVCLLLLPRLLLKFYTKKYKSELPQYLGIVGLELP